MVGLQQQGAVAAQPVVLGGRVNVSHARRRASGEEHNTRGLRGWKGAQSIALTAEPGRSRAGGAVVWCFAGLREWAGVSEGVVSGPR